MTDIAAIGLAIEAIATLPGSEHEHKRAAIARLIPMRDRLIDPAPESSAERERANEWLTLLWDLRTAIGKELTGDATIEDFALVVARVDAALARS